MAGVGRNADVGVGVDGIEDSEGAAVQLLADLLEFGGTVAGFGWVVDGIEDPEVVALQMLADLLRFGGELVSPVQEWHWLRDELTPLESRAIEVLMRLAQVGRELAGRVVRQPWLADGIDSDDLSFINVLTTMTSDPCEPRFGRMLERRYSRVSTVSLPLAGDVEIRVHSDMPWPSREPAPLSLGDDMIRPLKEAMHLNESYLGVPFPSPMLDILLVHLSGQCSEPDGPRGKGGPGRFRMTVYPTPEVNASLLAHELAHSYFHGGLPGWMGAGPAEYFERRIEVEMGIVTSREAYDRLVRTAEQCRGESDYRDCGYYVLGELLLSNVAQEIGFETVRATLAETARLAADRSVGPFGRAVSEHDIYQVFLENTPEDRRDAMTQIWKRLLGELPVSPRPQPPRAPLLLPSDVR